MSPLQFSLFFLALVVCYILVHLRLVRFEAWLKELAELKQLNERLKQVAEGIERVQVGKLEEGLDQLHLDGQDLLSAAKRLELGQTQGRAEQAQAVAQRTELSHAERLLAAVEDRLFQMGYRKLRILTDLRSLPLDEEVEIAVECERNLMPCKGRVRVHNGAVHDVDLHSVVKMFP